MVESRAAFGFRQRHRGQAEFRGLAKCFAREVAGFVEFAGQRAHFVFGKLAHRAAQQFLFFGERKIQVRLQNLWRML